MADATGVPFYGVFMLNLGEELSYFYNTNNNNNGKDAAPWPNTRARVGTGPSSGKDQPGWTRSCSDSMLCVR